ncbi:DUF3055 domain-containing protein [Domibacillus enclensis]|uniref:Cytosolic protein n=1 Tax=Domibacillus enclensis TaxID=1017273 RepID=A0A1N6YCN7_9BACI|nr:DUF3055 domain-containing protein [Domibacillus enclensis]OXS77591.1 cytosolic protein [Domibacillus enclensis]SIR12259.1 Protein of unknown function [Domibacillus enclensis]
MSERFFLYDEKDTTTTRFVSFAGEHARYDLALMQTDRYYGKRIVINLQGNTYAIIGRDDLDEPGYIEYAFKLSEEEAAELKDFLYEVI